MISEIETERLLLRPLQLSDAETTQRLFPHWDIVCYLSNQIPWPYPANGALTYYRDVALPAMLQAEEWHWALRLKGGPEHLLGVIALFKKENNNRGFWLGSQWQRKGLMSEAVPAVNDYWFDVLGFPALRAPKAAVNEASRRISLNTGMRMIATEDRDYVSGRLLTEVWEITAEEWRARRGTGYNPVPTC